MTTVAVMEGRPDRSDVGTHDPVGSPPPTFSRRVLDLLPKGVPLTDAAWQTRHRFILAVLWLHIPLLATVALARGYNPAHLFADVLPIVAAALVGTKAPGRAVKGTAVSVGLLACEGLLVHFTGGIIEAHFAFFVLMPLVALYQDVLAFVITLAFVVVHHTVVTLISPSSVFNHYAALNKPLLWACIHAAFVLGLVGVMMAFWKFAEQAQIEIAKASGEMSRTADDVDQVSQRLTESVEIQSLSVDMINDALLEAQATLEQLKATNPRAVADVSEIFQAVQVMVGDLTEQQARNSALAAKAMSDLTAQASHLGSLVSAVGAKA
jgi:hypothetical protein